MSLKFKKLRKQEAVGLLFMHHEAFPGEEVRDFSDDHCWVILDGKKEVGFCSLSVLEEENAVFLSRAASFQPGYGIHRKSILHRLAWAKKFGSKSAITYVSKDNYLSIANLIRTGFRFYDPEWAYAGRKDYFYFQKKI